MFRSLTGRFLLLTIIFVMLAEVLIFLPSVARFRHEYLKENLERAEIASLTADAWETRVPPPQSVQNEILKTTGVLSVVITKDNFREQVLAESNHPVVDQAFDLRMDSAYVLMRDAVICMLQSEDRIIRIIGEATQTDGQLIEATLYELPLKNAIWNYGRNILYLSLLISVITAVLLFAAVRRFIVQPIRGVVASMTAFRDNPEDIHGIIVPHSGVKELREAEDALQNMQQTLSSSLKQKERLAQLGGAVAKVSHDLRNMLTTATLLADRMEASEDPAVTRTAPKLVGSLNRAINLCEQTLAFGKSEEPPPRIARIDLAALVSDVAEAESLRAETSGWSLDTDIPAMMTIEADSEQLYRVVINLARNARQAISASGRSGRVAITARADGEAVAIDVSDNGPGLPVKAREKLFRAFEGGTRREGTGLGLAIAAELVKGHGGSLELVSSGPEGTTFRITLPHAFPQFAPTAVQG